MTRLLTLCVTAFALLLTGCTAGARPTDTNGPGSIAPSSSAVARVALADQLLDRDEINRVLAPIHKRAEEDPEPTDAPFDCGPTPCGPTALGTTAAFPPGYERYAEARFRVGPNNDGVNESLVRYRSAAQARAVFDRIVAAARTSRDRHQSSVTTDGNTATWSWFADGPTLPIAPFHTFYAIRLDGALIATASLRDETPTVARAIADAIPVAR